MEVEQDGAQGRQDFQPDTPHGDFFFGYKCARVYLESVRGCGVVYAEDLANRRAGVDRI